MIMERKHKNMTDYFLPRIPSLAGIANNHSCIFISDVIFSFNSSICFRIWFSFLSESIYSFWIHLIYSIRLREWFFMELQWGFVPDHGAILYRMLMKDYSQALGEVTLLTNIVHCCCLVLRCVWLFATPWTIKYCQRRLSVSGSEIFFIWQILYFQVLWQVHDWTTIAYV